MVFVALLSHPGDAVEASAIKTIFCEHATSGALTLSSTKVNFRVLTCNLRMVNIEFYWHN